MKIQNVTVLSMIAGMAIGAAPALADPNHDCGDGSCQVYTAYADTLHTSPGFLPSPWCGSSSVAFCFSNNKSLDSGAIRILNNGPDDLQVNGVTVSMWGPPTPGVLLIDGMNPWGQNNSVGFTCVGTLPPGGVKIPKGKNAVFAQTCTNNFDTSDLPAPPQVTCTNDKVISEVDVSFGDQPSTVAFFDLPQALNTHGIDPAACTGANEGINWQNITNNNGLPPFP